MPKLVDCHKKNYKALRKRENAIIDLFIINIQDDESGHDRYYYHSSGDSSSNKILIKVINKLDLF